MMKMACGLTAAMLLTSCAMGAQDRVSDGRQMGNAAIPLRAADGSERGSVRITQRGSGLIVLVEGANLPPGAHGAHIHAVGRCDAPDFASAGPHWNPTGRQHGRDNPAGAHLGDMPNLSVGTNGRGSAQFSVASARLRGGATPLLDADGAAFVIHAAPDDHRTDPSGNSGARIACAVLR